jgi:hypothetical protein
MSLEAAPTNNGTTAFRMAYPDTTKAGTLAIPCRDHVNAATVTSLLMTDYSWLPPGVSVNRLILQGGILTMQRNEAVQRMEGDWLLFIDDDMVFEPGDIGRLVATREQYDLDIVGGLCFRRSAPHQPTLYMREGPESGGYNFLEDWDDDIVEVDATGLAFAIIHKRVFESIAGTEMPPLDVRVGGRPPSFFRWGSTFGEDLAFCQDAKAAGCSIWVDTRIEIGHVAERIITKRDYWAQIAVRSPGDEYMRREVNDKMGLPTLGWEQAKEKLGWR